MRRDLERYILDLADQSIKMKAEVDKINKYAKEQEIPEEILNNLKTQIDIIEANYQRVLYCKYLLDLKPKWIRDIIDRKAKKKAKQFIARNADKDSVIKEGNVALNKIKEIFEWIKK